LPGPGREPHRRGLGGPPLPVPARRWCTGTRHGFEKRDMKGIRPIRKSWARRSQIKRYRKAREVVSAKQPKREGSEMRRTGWYLGVLAVLVAFLLPATACAQSGELEIFSWWAGDEGPALEALIEHYESLYPNVRVINATVTGGAGVNAKAVLKTRMLGGDPPDTFQVHAGQELIGTWVLADRMEDLTFLYEEEGWYDVLPEDLIKLLSTDEGIWSVAVNIHRSNVMYYIPEN